MTLFEIIGAILIGPLKLLFEVIFSIASKIVGNPGLAIIILSLAMNALVLPLYKRADAIQIEARDTENKLKDTIAHIKKTFSGDERMMILQTYYRQNHYSPLSVLSGSISLMLEIPFFMAAYQFLSGVGAFEGTSFGLIRDLSLPDGMIVIGDVAINVLPIIMTVVNVISSTLFLKGFPLKTKIQLYGMALFFLVFLYNSPAALVFYWTLNNAFSLVKTLFYRIKNSKKILNISMAVAGAALFVASFWVPGKWEPFVVALTGIALELPWAKPVLQARFAFLRKEDKTAEPNKKLFVLGGLFLAVLVGFLIPSTFISASVQEYIDVNYFYAPIWNVVNTLCIAIGTFLVWFGVFYWLAEPKKKVFFGRLVWMLSGIMLVNYMFFGTKLGIISANLVYETGLVYSWFEYIFNIVVMIGLVIGLYWVVKKFPRKLPTILLVASIALAGMSAINTVNIVKVTAETEARLSKEGAGVPEFSLSQDGQNVVVIMLDRGIGPFVPYIMEENPELKEQFDGFTYYPNTLTYGPYTNFATPSLYGGYEYTPVNMNLRSDELLVDKHNEALKVMPTLFAGEGYDVTLLDPSYAGYQVIPDMSIFSDIDGVTVYRANGKFDNMQKRIAVLSARRRNFFMFSLMKALPVSLQAMVYNDGKYQAQEVVVDEEYAGLPAEFVSEYNVVSNLKTMTTVSDGNENTFMFYRTNITHEPVILQEPNYDVVPVANNSAYYTNNIRAIRSAAGTYVLPGTYAISHYHTNTLTYMLLGDWFDYLRENGVYDNTRIIVVSDHSRDLSVFSDTQGGMRDIDHYQPILLVKDFNTTGFTTSEEFMTIADVSLLAMEDIIENPVNPFTGNPMNDSMKTDNEKQYIIISKDWNVAKNNGYQYLPSEWAAVTGSARVKENWEYYIEPAVLPPEFMDTVPETTETVDPNVVIPEVQE